DRKKRNDRTVVLDVEPHKGRIQSQQKQAIANREGVVKNPVPRTHDNILHGRSQRHTDSRRPVVTIGFVQSPGRRYHFTSNRIKIRDAAKSFSKWRLIVVANTRIHGYTRSDAPVSLHIETRCPRSKIA